MPVLRSAGFAVMVALACCIEVAPLVAETPQGRTAEGTSKPTVEEIIDGICDYYNRVNTFSVEFSESFERVVWENMGKQKNRVEIEVVGKWTAKVQQETPLRQALERFEVAFQKGADVYINPSFPDSEAKRRGADSVTQRMVHTWDGDQERQLEQVVFAGRVPRYGDTFGHVAAGGTLPNRHGFRIGNFLLNFIDAVPRKTLRERLSNPERAMRIGGQRQFAGVHAIELSATNPQFGWSVWVAPEHGYVVVHQEIRLPEQPKPYWVQTVSRVARFGQLWFPVEGSIHDNLAMANPDLDPELYDKLHRFKVHNVVLNEPIGDGQLRVAWPPNTLIKDHSTNLSYRSGPGDVPTRTAALDEALAMARATMPPPVPRRSGWWLVLLIVVGMILVTGCVWGVVKWRRRTVHA